MNAVSEPGSPVRVNPHCLDRVVALSGQHAVIAAEDVYNEQGLKLIAKGSRVDHSTHERLIRFKLRKPIETSVTVENGVDARQLSDLAETLIATYPVITQTLVRKDQKSLILNKIGQLRFDPASTLLLSLQQNEAHRMEHAVLVMLIAAGIGADLKLDETELENLMIAATLHDIGELYMAPDTHAGQEHPDQWRKIAGHTVIGEMVLQETTHFSRSVARAIGEHHERCSGFGYPRQLRDSDISPIGKILQTAEMLSGHLGNPDCDPLRIDHALKIVHGDFPRPIVNAVISANTQHRRTDQPEPFDLIPTCNRAQALRQRIDSAIAWIEQNERGEPTQKALAKTAQERLLMLRSALHSTGICAISSCVEKWAKLTHTERIELDSIVEELGGRLGELARLIALRAHVCGDAASEFAVDLHQRLDEQPRFAPAKPN